MICIDVESLIGPYVDNDLGREARHRVESHLLTCRECAWEAQTLQITRERLREGVGEVVASDAFRARLLSRLHSDNLHLDTSERAQSSDAQFQLPMSLPERSPRF